MGGLFSSSGKKEYTENQTTKMVITSVVDALAHLSSVVTTEMPYLPVYINLHHQVKDLQLQFRFLQMFLCFFPQWDCHDQNLLSRFSHIAAKTESVCEGPYFNARYWVEWIAAELKDPTQECKAEINKKYIEHLIPSSLKSDAFKRNETLKVHDVIRDFCRTEAQQQHYWCFINSHNSKVSTPSVRDQYRVCIEDEWTSFVDSKPRGPTVHSLLLRYSSYCVFEETLESFLCNFKLVQVLDLRLVGIDGWFPKAVTTLVHLRYAALSIRAPSVTVLSEISNLWNLETLLLVGIERYLKVEFPYDIWKMKKLRHVETDGEAHVALDDDVSGVLSQLPGLETFTLLVIPPGKDGDELLRRLPNVRKLSCLIDGRYRMPKLDILTNVESLQMRVNNGPGFARYPYTFNSFHLTIRKLTIGIFNLRWTEFTAVIRKLPTLQVLVLRGTKSSEDAKIWDVEDEEFPNIKSLTLHGLDIKEWKASIDSFPCIEKLNLSYCGYLMQVPPCFGEVPALKSVMVTYCNKGVVDSALQIQKDQLDSGYEMNLEVMEWSKVPSF